MRPLTKKNWGLLCVDGSHDASLRSEGRFADGASDNGSCLVGFASNSRPIDTPFTHRVPLQASKARRRSRDVYTGDWPRENQ